MSDQNKPFAIELYPSDESADIAVACLSGYLDAHTVVDFEKQIEAQTGSGIYRFILDARDLNYISSAGIGALMKIDQLTRNKNGGLVILQPSANVFSIFEMLGFNQIFRFAQDTNEALEILREIN